MIMVVGRGIAPELVVSSAVATVTGVRWRLLVSMNGSGLVRNYI